MSLNNIEQIWSEKDLAERFGLPVKQESGKSRTIGGWVSKGLHCAVYISGRRYFFESDIIEFFSKEAEVRRDQLKVFKLDTSPEELSVS